MKLDYGSSDEPVVFKGDPQESGAGKGDGRFALDYVARSFAPRTNVLSRSERRLYATLVSDPILSDVVDQEGARQNIGGGPAGLLH